MSSWLRTPEAKRRFFLESSDLSPLDHMMDKPPCPFFCPGYCPAKIYRATDLEQAALDKHGHDGLALKRARRAKREENKRKREELGTNDTAHGAIPFATPSTQQIRSVRKAVTDLLKPKLCYVTIRGYPSMPKKVKVQVRGVPQEVFASLIGLANDPQLATLKGKEGGWYNSKWLQECVRCDTFFVPGAIPKGPLRYDMGGWSKSAPRLVLNEKRCVPRSAPMAIVSERGRWEQIALIYF
jgi:hypothetical protein